MRSFSEIEKRWIRQIIETDRVGEFFGNLLDPSLNNSNIKIDCEEQAVFIKSSITDDYAEMGRAGWKLLYIERVLIELTELIGFLESQGLVIIYKLVDNAEGEFGTFIEGDIPAFYMINDPGLTERLIRYNRHVIVPTRGLCDFEKRGFIDEEEQRFQRQLKATWIGIAIAFLTGLASIIFDILR